MVFASLCMCMWCVCVYVYVHVCVSFSRPLHANTSLLAVSLLSTRYHRCTVNIIFTVNALSPLTDTGGSGGAPAAAAGAVWKVSASDFDDDDMDLLEDDGERYFYLSSDF